MRGSFLLRNHKFIGKLKVAETFVILLVAALWILIHACFTKAYTFGIGLDLPDSTKFEGFSKTLDGWNCAYPEFYIFPLLWLAILSFSYWMITNMIQNR